MIKKYITLAALLSAGTALANAAWVDKYWKDMEEDVVITTKFSGINSTSATSTTTVTGTGEYFSRGVSVGNPTFSGPNLMTSGNATTSHNSLVPDFDVSTANASWTLNLNYNFRNIVNAIQQTYQTSVGIKIESVEIKLGAVGTNGKFVGQNLSTGEQLGNHYNLLVTLTPTSGLSDSISMRDTNKWVIASSGKDSLGYGVGPQDNPQKFDFLNEDRFSPAKNQSLVLSQDIDFAFNVGNATNSTTGTIGIQEITLKTSLMREVPAPEAPEPSAFGLLAGLGALALVASRRRRK